MRFDYTQLDPAPTQVIANIPYHITTPLLWKILEDLAPGGLYSILLMVQKEAALRLQAVPKDKRTLSLSASPWMPWARSPSFVQCPLRPSIPRPKVDSAILHIQLEQRRELPRIQHMALPPEPSLCPTPQNPLQQSQGISPLKRRF